MRALLVLGLLSLTVLAGCMDDTPPAAGRTPEAHGPVGNSPFNGTLSAFGETFGFEMPGDGQGIWIHDDVLLWTNGQDLYLADVSDPEAIVMLGNLTGLGARDVDVLDWNGRTYAALAGSGRGVHLIDITDPADPIFINTTQMPSAGVHNLAAIAGTPYIYSSGASGVPGAQAAVGQGSGKVDVLDITDPSSPVIHTFVIPAIIGATPVESDGCHDISVRADLARAYCAGGGGRYYGAGGETFIWDISDPLDPIWLAAIDDPRIKYHHQAFVNDGGDILIINDEYVGPFLPGVPVGANNCFDAGLPLVGSEDQIPTAAAWVYDISDEANPVQMAFIQNDAGWDGEGLPPSPAEGNCGSHFGDLVTGQEAFVMGWYQGGTILVDFSDPADPVILDIEPADGSHWDSRYWRGHVYHAGADLVVSTLV